MPEPESQADALIVVDSLTPGGPLFITLKGETETVSFGPYPSPSLAYLNALTLPSLPHPFRINKPYARNARHFQGNNDVAPHGRGVRSR